MGKAFRAAAKGFDPETKAAVRLREDATSYLAWAYDLAAEKARPDVSAARERLATVPALDGLGLFLEAPPETTIHPAKRTIEDLRKDTHP